MGKSSGNQQVTTTTQLPSWYTDVAKTAMDQARDAASSLARPYMGNQVANIDPVTGRAINLINQNVGSTNAQFANSQRGATEVMNYDPRMVQSSFTPANIRAGTQNYNYRPSNVNAGSFLNQNVQAYMNPYIANVEKQAMGRLGEQRQQALNANAETAARSGAFGGSRHGIVEAVTNAESAKNAGELSANLRSQAYDRASSLIEQDLGRGMNAQLANQQAGMQNAQFGANLGMQNIANNLAAQQFNSQMGYNAANLRQQAALANQNAGLQGAQLNLQAANQLGNLTAQGQQAYLQGLQQAVGAGQISQAQAQALLNQQANQYNAMRNYPAEQLNYLLAALGGAQVPTSTRQTTPTSGNWLTGAAGGALAGMSMGPWGALAGGLLGGLAGS